MKHAFRTLEVASAGFTGLRVGARWGQPCNQLCGQFHSSPVQLDLPNEPLVWNLPLIPVIGNETDSIVCNFVFFVSSIWILHLSFR